MNELGDSWGYRFKIWHLGAFVCLLIVAYWLFVPASVGRRPSPTNTCINNLRMIDGAKQQWALEKKKSPSDVPTWDDIKPYLGQNFVSGRMVETTKCPSGGQYTMGSVTNPPTCTIANHVLN